MVDVTIIKMSDCIIVPIQIELHDRAAVKLREDILNKIEETSATGLIIDVSAISVVDSFLGRLLGDTAKMATFMGTDTVLVGLRKEVVITMIQLGLVLTNIHTAMNLEDGLLLIEKLKRDKSIGNGV